MSNYQNRSIQRLFKAISNINTPKECEAFFDDLCTIKEIQDMAQRFDTAILLDEGLSYQKIAEKVGVSTATISRVNRCLTYGSNGYRIALDNLSETEKNDDGK